MDFKKNTEVSDGISLHEILIEVINKKFLVIGIVAICVLFSFVYTQFFATPKYTACAKMLIIRSSNPDQQMSTGDFSVSSYLIKDYTEIILDKVVLGRVAKEVDSKLTVGQIKGSIKIENPSNSRVLEIYVTSESPEQAQKIANKICSVSKEEIFGILKQDTINIMSTADVPKAPSSPNLWRNVFYAFIGGLVLSVVVISLYGVFDDTIKGKNDINKYLGLEVLSVIPYVRSKENSTQSSNRGIKNGRN